MARSVFRVGVTRWFWVPAFAGMTEQGMPEAAARSRATVPFTIAKSAVGQEEAKRPASNVNLSAMLRHQSGINTKPTISACRFSRDTLGCM